MQIDQKLVDGLSKIGLTKYQALAYIASVGLGEATAYKIAEESGVPRSKVYENLDDLVELGFMSKITSEKGTLYVPLPPIDTFSNALKEITTELGDVEKGIKKYEEMQKERSTEPPIIIFNNVKSLMGQLETSEFYEAWIDNSLTLASEIRKLLNKKKCEIHQISSTIPLAFIMGPIDSFFVRGSNGSQMMIKFSNNIIQQILGMVEKTKPEYREEMTRESGVKILRETSIMDVEDKIKLIVPGFNLKQEKILFWGLVDNAKGIFDSNNPCDFFITESRIFISADDGRVFARAHKFIQKMQLVNGSINLIFGKVGGTETLTIKSEPYVKVIDGLLAYILK